MDNGDAVPDPTILAPEFLRFRLRPEDHTFTDPYVLIEDGPFDLAIFSDTQSREPDLHESKVQGWRLRITEVSTWIEKPGEKAYDEDQNYFQEEKHGKRDHQDGLRGLHVWVWRLGS